MTAEKEIKKIIDAAKKSWPTPDYTASIEAIRNAFENRQRARLAAKIKKRYEKTHAAVDPIALNITKATASRDAQVYRQKPERYVEIDGERSEEQTEALAELLKASNVDLHLKELEVRAKAAGCMFGRVSIDVAHKLLTGESRFRIDTYWPDHVLIKRSQAAPGALYASDAVLLEIYSDDDKRWFEMWSRSNTYDADGVLVGFGDWYYQQVSEDGKSRTARKKYPGKYLPIFVVQAEYSERIFVPPPEDLIDQQDAVNILLTSWFFAEQMQGHAERYYTGNARQAGKEFVGGPGAMLEGEIGSTFGVLSYDHDATGLNGLEKTLRMHAITREQVPDDWSTEPGAPLTGESRKVRNAHADARRLDDIERMKHFEEIEFWPMALEVNRLWGDIEIDADAVVKTKFPPPQKYEDPMGASTRAKFQRDAGWISDADAAVSAGVYDTVEDAEAAGLSTSLEKASEKQIDASRQIAGMQPANQVRALTADGQQDGEQIQEPADEG